MSAPARKFSVGIIIRRVLREEASEDWDVLVKTARAAITPDHYAEAIDEMLPVFIRREMTKAPSGRRTRISVVPPGPQEARNLRPVAPDPDRDAEARQAYFDVYITKCLDERWTTASGKKRRLGDMDAQDCAHVATRSREDARKLLAVAGMFDAFQSALGQHQVRTVRDLPVSFLVDMFKRAA